MKKFPLAVDCFTKCISCDPTISDAWKRRGQVRTAQGELVESLNDLNQAIKLNSKDADAYMQRGLTYQITKDFQLALNDFRQIVVNNSSFEKNAMLLNYIGMCEAQLGNLDVSISHYTKALEIDPDYKEAAMNLAQMRKVQYSII